jgi:hypothetical protein
MKTPRCLIAVCALVFTVSCATTKIAEQHDQNYDFSAWKTFGWLPNHGDVGQGSPFWPDIKGYVEQNLAAKGTRPAGPDQKPDFLVCFSSGVGQLSNFSYYGYAPGTWWVTNPRLLHDDDFAKGYIGLDFVDPGSMKMEWRGVAKTAFDERTLNKPDELLATLRQLLPRILSGFPPKPGTQGSVLN